jgi:hypothetical protein
MRNLPAGKLTISSVTPLARFSVNEVLLPGAPGNYLTFSISHRSKDKALILEYIDLLA